MRQRRGQKCAHSDVTSLSSLSHRNATTAGPQHMYSAIVDDEKELDRRRSRRRRIRNSYATIARLVHRVHIVNDTPPDDHAPLFDLRTSRNLELRFVFMQVCESFALRTKKEFTYSPLYGAFIASLILISNTLNMIHHAHYKAQRQVTS